jgi:hypothetical protein
LLERVEVFVDVAFLDDLFWFGAGSIGDVISGLASFLFGRSVKATIKIFSLESKQVLYYLRYVTFVNISRQLEAFNSGDRHGNQQIHGGNDHLIEFQLTFSVDQNFLIN